VPSVELRGLEPL